jgi:hypothetical protein
MAFPWVALLITSLSYSDSCSRRSLLGFNSSCRAASRSWILFQISVRPRSVALIEAPCISSQHCSSVSSSFVWLEILEERSVRWPPCEGEESSEERDVTWSEGHAALGGGQASSAPCTGNAVLGWGRTAPTPREGKGLSMGRRTSDVFRRVREYLTKTVLLQLLRQATSGQSPHQEKHSRRAHRATASNTI